MLFCQVFAYGRDCFMRIIQKLSVVTNIFCPLNLDSYDWAIYQVS